SAIREQLHKRGLSPSDDERDLAEHVFSAGFSTSPIVTAVSGRGVGLEVVKTKVQSMRGVVDLTFQPGRRTQFKLLVPFTLTSLRALILEAGRQIFAIDTASVERVLRIGADDVQSVEGREVVMLAGRPVHVVTLVQMLGLHDQSAPIADRRRPAVVLT